MQDFLHHPAITPKCLPLKSQVPETSQRPGSWKMRLSSTWGDWQGEELSENSKFGGATLKINMGVSENVVSTPLYPMVLLIIIIPIKNGYFIGNIPNIFRQTHIWNQEKMAHFQVSIHEQMLGQSLIERCPQHIIPSSLPIINGHFRILKWRYLPYIRPI